MSITTLLCRVAAAAFGTMIILGTRAEAAPVPQFHEGDIYILSASLPSPPVGNAGLLRVDPNNGAVQQVMSADSNSINPHFVFDSFRGKLVMAARPTGAPTISKCILVDADGTYSVHPTMPYSIRKMATTGDGRIYYMLNTGTSTSPLQYIDAADALHDVLNETGTANFSVPSASSTYGMIYEPQTNSIWVATFPNSTPNGPAWGIYKIPLNAAGTQLSSAPQLTLYNINNGVGGFYYPNRLSVGANGNVFVALNSTVTQPSVNAYSINPLTMTGSTYSSYIDTVHPGTLTMGIYSNYLNGMLFIDTFQDSLRHYSQGSTGAGFQFDAGLVSSNGGSGEVCGLAEVQLASAGLGFFGTGIAGCNGVHKLTANRSANINATDFMLICTNAPPSSLGLILITDAADPIGTDLFNLNFPVYLDLFAATQILTADIVSNPLGLGSSPAPIFIDPSLLGMTFYEQAIWYWSACSPPSGTGFSASNGLVTTILP